MAWYHDKEFSNLLQAVDLCSHQQDGVDSQDGVDPEKDKDLPPIGRIHQKIARLLYEAQDNIDVNRALSNYGGDSMMGRIGIHGFSGGISACLDY